MENFTLGLALLLCVVVSCLAIALVRLAKEQAQHSMNIGSLMGECWNLHQRINDSQEAITQLQERSDEVFYLSRKNAQAN